MSSPKMNAPTRTLSAQDLADLKWAQKQLEHASFAARLSNALGSPIEYGLRLLPKHWYKRLQDALEFSIRKTLDTAITSMGHIPPSEAHDYLHKLMVAGSGAMGGFFGPITLLAELPVTTAIMLRSIADIAHSQGEDLTTLEARLACMEVFALGGRTKEDDAADTGYYGLRIMLGFHFSSSLLHTGGTNIPVQLPGGVELVRAITARFGVAISDKAAAQIIPIAGAVSGAFINLIFLQHFQDMARGHFIVRRLERVYGSEVVKAEYYRLTHLEANAEAKAGQESSNLEGW